MDDDSKEYSGLLTEDYYPSAATGGSSPDKGSQGARGGKA